MTVSSKNIALSAISTIVWLLLCLPAIATEIANNSSAASADSDLTDSADSTDSTDLSEWNVDNFKTTMTDLFSCDFQMSPLTNTPNELFNRMGAAIEDMLDTLDIDDMVAMYDSQYNCDFTGYDATSGVQAVVDEFEETISGDEATDMMKKAYNAQTIELLNKKFSCDFSIADYDSVVDVAKNLGEDMDDADEDTDLDEDTHDADADADADADIDIVEVTNTRGLMASSGRNLQVDMEELIDMQELIEIMKNIDDQELTEEMTNFVNTFTGDNDFELDQLNELMQQTNSQELQVWLDNVYDGIMTTVGEYPAFDALCKESLEDDSEDSLDIDSDSNSAAMSFLPSFRSFTMILVSVSYLCAVFTF